MSFWERGIRPEIQETVNGVLETVGKAPSLMKDEGIKSLAQDEALRAYGQLLEETGVLPEDIDRNVTTKAWRMKSKAWRLNPTPRQETEIFASGMHRLRNGHDQPLEVLQIRTTKSS